MYVFYFVFCIFLYFSFYCIYIILILCIFLYSLEFHCDFLLHLYAFYFLFFFTPLEHFATLTCEVLRKLNLFTLYFLYNHMKNHGIMCDI